MNYNYLRYMLHIARKGALKSKAIAFIVSRKLSHESWQESIKNLLQHGKKPFRKMEFCSFKEGRLKIYPGWKNIDTQ